MAKIDVIRKGESLPFCYSRNGEDITNWICTIVLKQYPADTAIISRTILGDTDKRDWTGYLTAAETAALSASSTSPYTLTGVLTNAITAEESQIPIRFNVAPSWN